MHRRNVIVFVAGMSLVRPFAARAQDAGRPARIGLLIPDPGPTAERQPGIDAFRSTLRELGWVEGRNLAIETRWAGVDPQRQRDVAGELKAIPVALIVAIGTAAIRTARDGAPGVPVVMLNAGDPVGAGLVASLARPGGDLTGTSAAGEEVLAKQLELMSAAIPGLKRVSVLMNRANPANGFFFDVMSARAKSLRIPLDRIEVETAGELEQAVARAKGGALMIMPDPLYLPHRVRLAEYALRSRVPSISGDRRYVDVGALMSYTSVEVWHYRAAAGFVDRILKGGKPATLPVEQPTTFELTINLGTAKALGIAIPAPLLQRADRVIP